jgi:hypothetical protein
MDYAAVRVIITIGTGFKVSVSKATDFYLTFRFVNISFPIFVSKFAATTTATRGRRTTGFTVGTATTNFSH